jgi:hypothetical protein
LPQSFLGRSLLTWFNPGPGTGYMFALGNLLAAVVASLVLLTVWYSLDPSVAAAAPPASLDKVLNFIIAGYAYVVIFLGLGRLIVRVLQRVAPVGIALSVLVQILLLVAGCGIPLTVYLMSPHRGLGYSLMHITNPVWTLVEMVDGPGIGYEPLVQFLLVGTGTLIYLVNLPGIAAEVRHVRVAKPLRVAQEDALAAAQSAPPRAKTNPWDEGE